MASVASQLIEEVTAHVQSDSLDDAREICADGTYFLNNLRMCYKLRFYKDFIYIYRRCVYSLKFTVPTVRYFNITALIFLL